jgi:PAS domain S-box-containing protein
VGLLKRIYPITLASLPIFVGLTIALDWMIYLSAPMPLNTAFFFVISGFAMSFSIRGFIKSAKGLAGIIGGISSIRFVDYLGIIYEGIIKFEFFGIEKMAPDSVACFILFSSALILKRRKAQSAKNFFAQLPEFLIAVLFGLSILSLISRMMGFQIIYEWGSFSQMSILTSFCFMSLATSFLLTHHYLDEKQNTKNIVHIPIVTAATLISLTLILWQTSFPNETEEFHRVVLFAGLVISFLMMAVVRLTLIARYQAYEKSRMLEELKENQSFLSTILDNLPVALFCKDYENQFSFSLWNKKATELLGLKQEQVLGKSDLDFFPKNQADFFRIKDVETMSHGKIVDVPEESVTTPKGNVLILHTKKVPIFDHAGNPKYLLGISEDITEKKQVERYMEDQRLKILHNARLTSLGEMASGLAHEINNPLGIIKMNVDQMRTFAEMGKLDISRLMKISGAISSTVDRIAKIIKGLRDFAGEGESGPFKIVKLRELISDTLDFCMAKFGRHGINLELADIKDDLVLVCRGVEISQVILNLLNNAFDAVADKPDAFVKIDVVELKDEIEISVTDSGNGIPKEIASKIMQPFFTTKEIGKGMGLGLSISVGIVKAHHGQLYLDQTSNNTRFVIKLPKRQDALELERTA